MNGFERRTAAKREHILASARELFFQKGPARTSVAEIARHAGVSQVTIYNYFTSKETLIQIVIREHLDAAMDRAEGVMALDLPFREKLERFLGLGAQEDDRVSDESLAGFDWRDKNIRSIYEAFVVERQIPFLVRFVEMGKAEGAIDAKLSTEAVLAFFGAHMSLYRDPEFLNKGKDYIAGLGHLFFYGLLGR
ncbi:MAG: TetR/AcrR family transcriptional regulator [Spirochaetales bacterium]|nr:TetR/AcrR family transcriptional regulator [Spirochaetales bacterium]